MRSMRSSNQPECPAGVASATPRSRGTGSGRAAPTISSAPPARARRPSVHAVAERFDTGRSSRSRSRTRRTGRVVLMAPAAVPRDGDERGDRRASRIDSACSSVPSHGQRRRAPAGRDAPARFDDVPCSTRLLDGNSSDRAPCIDPRHMSRPASSSGHHNRRPDAVAGAVRRRVTRPRPSSRIAGSARRRRGDDLRRATDARERGVQPPRPAGTGALPATPRAVTPLDGHLR